MQMPQSVGARRGAAVGALVIIATTLLPGHVSAAPECFGREATIVGTDDDDRLRGTPFADVIVGRGGADEIDGFSGEDRICGGGDGDFIRGGPDDDLIETGLGFNSAYGGRGDDLIDGGYFNELLVGGAGDDVLKGRNGEDELVGDAGNDVLVGGPQGGYPEGRVHGDLVAFATRRDLEVDLRERFVRGQGTDTLIGVEGAYGGLGDDVLRGDGRHNYLAGGSGGDDVLKGRGGPDELYGQDGFNRLFGGAGRDLCLDADRHRSCERRPRTGGGGSPES